MANHVYAVSELVGTSPEGVEAAVQNALTSAQQTVRNMDWFEVTQIRGHLGDSGPADDWQVGIKLGFRVDK